MNVSNSVPCKSNRVLNLQGAVALYVFYKSWKSTDKRLLAAAILLFVTQARKATHKSLYLKLTSFDAIRNHARHASRSVDGEDENISPEKFIEDVSALIPSLILGHSHFNGNVTTRIGQVLDLPQTLCLDKAIAIRYRLVCLKYFWFLSDRQAYKLVEDGLSRIFSLYYTRDLLADIIYNLWQYTKTVYYIRFCLITLIRLAPIIISVSLFHMSDTEGYSREDVLVTFVLFYGTVLLDLSFLFLVVTFPLKWEWPRTIAQNSLLKYYIYKQDHGKWMFITRYFKIEGCHKMHSSCDSCKEILALVQQHVKDGWLHGIKDVEQYKEFNNTTGQWTLKRENCNQLIEWISRYPMDESVLVWHVATELCFYLGSPSADNVCAKRSREMSNYMVYLLHAKPDMLTVGSSSALLDVSVEQLERLLTRHRRHGTTIKYVRIRDVALDLIAEQQGVTESSGIIGKAWELAQRLRGLNDEAKLWRVIQGVWVEMLCFSAARCPSKVHARSLGSGGEYLSYVWLLQAYAGLETFPDKIQKRHLGSVFESSELRSANQRDLA
jgi:hypothetical protein